MNVGMECDKGDHVDAHAADAPNQLVMTNDPPKDPSKRNHWKSQGEKDNIVFPHEGASDPDVLVSTSLMFCCLLKHKPLIFLSVTCPDKNMFDSYGNFSVGGSPGCGEALEEWSICWYEAIPKLCTVHLD